MHDVNLEPIPIWDQLPALTWNEKVAYLTTQFLQMEQIGCPLEHSFSDCFYTREMRIPAGTLFIGRAHRYGHECKLLAGQVIHISEHGKRLVEAPFSMRTTPGYHMVIYTVTDIVSQTVHPNPTDSRDAQALENDIFDSLDSLKALGDQVHQRLKALP